MATRVRSFSKINLGLAIGPPRPDGFHSLVTLYQTVALHDVVSVSAQPAAETCIRLTSSDFRVPTDARNTAWRTIDRALRHCGITAEVDVHLEKNLPIQGGMGAGSANAAAALIGLERELSLKISVEDRLALAAEVGSDVPLFLVGGSVLGWDRGQKVIGVSDVTYAGGAQIPCVMALPSIGVSTPNAFREWDRLVTPPADDLQSSPIRDTLNELSRIYASVLLQSGDDQAFGTSGIIPDPSSVPGVSSAQNSPENLQRPPGKQRYPTFSKERSGVEEDFVENSLLAMVHADSGSELENDFERVVFPQYPALREIKQQLLGSTTEHPALYAALSGSGSALFGLYGDQDGAIAAQRRLQQHGVRAIVTSTLPRRIYWSSMFAE